MNIFLIKSVLLVCVLMFYKILEQLTVLLFRCELFTCFFESTIYLIVILTCGLEISYLKPPKPCTLHLRGFFLHPMRGGLWRKLTNDREESWCKNYVAAFGTILKIIGVFHKSEPNFFYSFFSSIRQPKNVKLAAQEHKGLKSIHLEIHSI